MTSEQHPTDPLDFIRSCVREKRILWTHHVNMRMGQRAITRSMVLNSTARYEIIESYPDRGHLPTYLVYSRHDDGVLHIVFAVDTEGVNVRVVTAYRPDPAQWQNDLKTRRKA
ncbi:MAG: DUF4258 domain-containing protein [Candidatus Lambdaproteobacteria bacterium]|nr:DUF4258 domain-containing protein [Candidatus Lambdaproteobacteria bacterium]